MPTPNQSKMLIATTALTATLIGTAVFAQVPAMSGLKQPLSCDRIADQIDRKLSLTDTQQPLFIKACEGRRAIMKRSMKARRALHSLATADTFDAAKAQSIASNWANSVSSQTVDTVRNFYTFYQSLTAEQRAQLKALRQHRHEHFDRRHKHREP